MKTPRTTQNLKAVLSLCALFLVISTCSEAATSPAPSPAIFYSDLTSGPKTGGQNNNGVFVTVWGNNFGSTQGSSTVTVGGGVVANYQTWTNNEICFQLGSLTATGNIVVTTSSGTSNGIPFTIRSGNIYFVQPGAATNGTGTYASPFNHLYYAYKIQAAGDTVYVLSGTISDEIDGQSGWHALLDFNSAVGTQASPVAYVAYPNDTVILSADGGTATWTDGSSGGSDGVIYDIRSSGGTWVTISKFTIKLVGTGGSNAIEVTDFDGWRIVGNTVSGDSWTYGLVSFSNNYSQILGNTIQNSGASMAGGYNNEAHTIYWDAGGSNVQIAWNYIANNQKMGWAIDAFHGGTSAEPTRSGSIHDNYIENPNSYQMKGILVGEVDSGETVSDVWTQNIQVYNNVIYNAGAGLNTGAAIQLWAGTAYVYNNTIYGCLDQDGCIQLPTVSGTGPGGGLPVFYISNNIIDVPQSSTPYITGSGGAAPNWSEITQLTNNNYYGQSNGPSQDLHPINANPQFVTPGTNFQLQSTSPDINAGYNTLSVVTQDVTGLLRGSTPSIGAYEYSSAAPTPVVAITSPASGVSITAGSNVSITATASETTGSITNIALYNGSTLLGQGSTSPYTFVMNNPGLGIYNLTAVATDANGVSKTSSAVIVTIISILPSTPVVTITSPTTGSSYTAGSNVTITTTASESNGTISNVALYSGTGILLGQSSTSPYSYVFNNIAAGSYSFYAVATDAISVSTTSSSITVTATTPLVAPSITTQPVSATVTAPATATFTVAATGTPVPTYQWQQEASGASSYTTISGATSASYTTAATTTANGGTKYECVVTNSSGSVTSNAATLTVNPTPAAPSITTQPVSATVTAPATATFTVAATGTPAPTYQWQQEASGASSYTTISGATSASYTTAATTTANSGTKYECVVTNSSGSVTSNAATLTVNPTPAAPSITTQPVSATITAPATATFTVTATGTPTPTYQWQQEASGASSYTTISGATSASYTTAATTTANSGTKYECVVTNSSGSVTSNAATLTVNPAPVAPSITTQPVSVTVTAPATANFTVVATGTPAPTYQWQQEASGASSYTTISGATSASYTTPATTTANNGTKYECVVTNSSGSVISNAVTLTVNPTPAAPSITTQPVSVTVTAPATASFTVVATGTPAPTYQWQQEVSGALFYTTINGATSASYTTPATTTANSGTKYECVVTNASGTVTSNPAILMVNGLPVVTMGTNQAAYTAPASIQVTAIASETNGTISKIEFFNGSTLLATVTSMPYTFSWTNVAVGNYSLTAVAFDSNGNSTTSAPASVTVSGAPVVSLATNNASFTAPASIDLTATASESNGTIAIVYFYNGSTLLGSTMTSPYTFTWTNVPAGSYSLTAVAKDWYGVSTTSSAKTVTVTPSSSSPVVVVGTNQAAYTAPASIQVTAIASETNGTISKVEFFNGSTLLATVTGGLYTYTWTNVPVGNYNLTAVAFDTNGNSTTSAPASVIVGGTPVVSLVTNNTSLTAPATINLTATASVTNATIAIVYFYNGSTLLGSTMTSPYTYSWTNVPTGTYSLTAVAKDWYGASTTSSAATVTVTSPSSLPIVTMGKNQAAYTAPATIQLTATASETNGTISKVEFFNGSTLLATVTGGLYTYTWTNVPVGNYNLTAVAFDSNGNSTTSAPASVIVGGTPVVSLATDNTSLTAPATINLTATASVTNATIAIVYFYNGSTLLGSTMTSPYTYSWTNVPAGTYNLTAVAKDWYGASTTSSAATVTVTSPSSLPIVTMGTDDAAYTAPATIQLTAIASENNGTISKVEFFNGSTLLATVTGGLYTYTWTNVPVGNYNLTAVAFDTNGNSTTSAPASVTVSGVPVVSLAADNTTPGTINLTATASVANGTVAIVYFYNGSTLLGWSMTPPYTYTWTNVPAGSYNLTAVAKDWYGASSSSNPENVAIGS